MGLETRAQASLTLTSADTLAATVVHEAEARDKAVVAAIVDPSGLLLAFRRMDGAPRLAVEVAQNKAYTAASFGIPTHQWFDFIAQDEPLRVGIPHTDRIVVFGGGYPIQTDEGLVGALGVSGGHYTEDMQVAEAALRSVGLAV